jgi:hypothetical protein
MTLIEDMFDFLKQNEGEPYQVIPRVQKVLGIKFKDCDDDYGAIGEHYIVNCKMRWDDVVIDTLHEPPKNKSYEAVCLVSRKEFDNYRNKEQTIIWI